MKKLLNCKRYENGKPRYAQNTPEIREYNRSYWKANPWKNAFRRSQTRCLYDRNCNYYGMEFTITPEDVKRVWEHDGADLMIKPSIDRIDSNLGYTPTNIQIIPLKDNLRKAKRERKQKKERSI